MPQVLQFIIKNWKTIVAVLALLLGGGTLGGIIVSHHKRKVYNKLQEQHDAETAKRLSKEFEDKLDNLIDKYNKLKEKNQEAIAMIMQLCDQYNIPYSCVLKQA